MESTLDPKDWVLRLEDGFLMPAVMDEEPTPNELLRVR